MTFGLEIKNSSGNVIIDDTLPQLHQIDSGTAASTSFALGFTGSVTFSRSITNPIVFVRCAINSFFAIGVVTSTGFSYSAGGSLDWIVFEGAPASHTPSGFGLVVYNSSGQVIYDASKSFPLITQNSVALDSGDITSDAVERLLRTITHSSTAFDGGYPYVSATTFYTSHVLSGPGIFALYGTTGRFVSSTSLEIWTKQLGVAGSNPLGASIFQNGAKPRNVLFSR
jgi:hypothetical protein